MSEERGKPRGSVEASAVNENQTNDRNGRSRTGRYKYTNPNPTAQCHVKETVKEMKKIQRSDSLAKTQTFCGKTVKRGYGHAAFSSGQICGLDPFPTSTTRALQFAVGSRAVSYIGQSHSTLITSCD